MCGNGSDLIMCDGPKCSREICIGPNAQCLGLPVNLCFEEPEVLFFCPPCHQYNDHGKDEPTPYYVRSMPWHIPSLFTYKLLRASMSSQVLIPIWITPKCIWPSWCHLGLSLNMTVWLSYLFMNPQLQFVATLSLFHDQDFWAMALLSWISISTVSVLMPAISARSWGHLLPLSFLKRKMSHWSSKT